MEKNKRINKRTVMALGTFFVVLLVLIIIGICLLTLKQNGHFLYLTLINIPFVIPIYLSFKMVLNPKDDDPQKFKKQMAISLLVRNLSIVIAITCTVLYMYFMTKFTMPNALFFLVSPGIISGGYLVSYLINRYIK